MSIEQPDRYQREAFEILLKREADLHRAYKLRAGNPLPFVVSFEELELELTAFRRKAWREVQSELRRVEALVKECSAEYQRCLPLARKRAVEGPPRRKHRNSIFLSGGRADGNR